MGILNYTTKIDPQKTAGEIQQILGSKGARSISTEYEGGEAIALYFSMEVNGVLLNFRLPCNWRGVLAAMKRDRTIPRSYESDDQAKRTAWRIVKDWVEAQLAIIESGQAEMAEVFMPYAITSSGETLYKRLAAEPQFLLGYEEKHDA